MEKFQKLRRFVVPAAAIFIFGLSPTLVNAAIIQFGDTINYEINIKENYVQIQSKGELLFDDTILTSNSKAINASTTRFYSGDQFYKEGNAWYQIDYSTTTPEKFIDSQVSAFRWWEIPHAIADIFFPSSDGTLSRHASASWATTHDSADSNVADSASATRDSGVSESGGAYYLDRSSFFFDTSSISPDTVDTASFYVYVATKDDEDGTTYTIYSTSQTGFTNTDSNYSSCGTTAYSNTNEDPANTGYRQFLLNATGVAAINTTGTTKLCLRFLLDVNNSAPPGLNGVTISMSEQTGTTEDPYLDITFATAETPAAGLTGSSTIYLLDDPAITLFWGFCLFVLGILFILYVVK